MAILRKFFARNGSAAHHFSEVLPATIAGHAVMGIDDYYSALNEDRSYVIAMREVAADTLRSC